MTDIFTRPCEDTEAHGVEGYVTTEENIGVMPL